jgi:ABC-type multidrug transport system fused ATPase/permease subunit
MSNLKLILKNSSFQKLWPHLSKSRKKQFWLISILMIISSLSEIISIGAVLPFLGVLTSPDQFFQHPYMQPVIQILELTKPSQLITLSTFFFIFAVMLASIIRLVMLYSMIRFTYAIGADLSVDMYHRTLHQEYSVHVSRNSSEVINGVITKTNAVITGTIGPILTLISSTILIMGIVSVLLVIDPVVALLSFTGFGFLYLLVIYFTRNKIKNNSKIIAKESTQIVKSLQEGLGGIRDVLINRTQQFYCKLYQKADIPLRRAAGLNHFISICPRFIMEAIGITIIVSFAYVISLKEGGVIATIPLLGAIALGAQRLLPLLQQSYSSYAQIKGSRASFEDMLDLLNQPLTKNANPSMSKSIKFEKEIKINNLSFRYRSDLPWVLKNINLLINKGECIGFVGETGSGKSTLLDIIMGLLLPTSGGITIDHKPLSTQNLGLWQSHIAHVPQSVYLSDGTIQENIAFGIPKSQIDEKRIKEVAEEAQITNLIEQSENIYQTSVGERGVRLSGGQRQRIGIARALYKKADLLIFDEATSALDNNTELKIMNAINSLDKKITVLIIAHRLTTLKECDKIIKLNQDKTISVGTYQELLNG